MPTLTLVVTKRPHVLLVGLYSLYGGIRFHHMLTMSMLMLTAVPLANCQSGAWQSTGGKDANIDLYRCPYSICDNNSASTCGGQLSTKNYCQCRQDGGAISCPFVGKLLIK